jgi:MFS family permease
VPPADLAAATELAAPLPPQVATGDGEALPRLRRGPRLLSKFVGELGPTGWLPLGILVALAGVQTFDLGAFGILAPDIRHTFHLSVASVDAIAALTGALPVLFSVHLGYWGDRTNRIHLSVAAGLLWGVTAVVTGLAPAVAVLVIARTIGGVGVLTTETVYPSLLADFYGTSALGSVFTSYRWISAGLGLIGGPLAGVIAAVAGWRVAFVALALPTFVFASLLSRLREPQRGASMGLSMGDPMRSIREGFRRVRAIRSARRTWAAAFLFGAGTLPLQTVINNFFHDVYHLGDAARGYVSVIYGLGGLAGIIYGGRLSNKALAAGQIPRLAKITGWLVVSCGAGILVMSVVPFLGLSIAAAAGLTIGAFGFLPSYTMMIAFIAPPQLRAQAYGWSLLWYALGAITLQVAVVGPLIEHADQRVGLAVLGVLVAAGGLIGVSVHRFVNDDMARAFAPDPD